MAQWRGRAQAACACALLLAATCCLAAAAGASGAHSDAAAGDRALAAAAAARHGTGAPELPWVGRALAQDDGGDAKPGAGAAAAPAAPEAGKGQPGAEKPAPATAPPAAASKDDGGDEYFQGEEGEPEQAAAGQPKAAKAAAAAAPAGEEGQPEPAAVETPKAAKTAAGEPAREDGEPEQAAVDKPTGAKAAAGQPAGQAAAKPAVTSADEASDEPAAKAAKKSAKEVAAPAADAVAKGSGAGIDDSAGSKGGVKPAAAAAAVAADKGKPPARAGPKAEPKKVKIVEDAPEAIVENNDDIDPEGSCASAIDESSCREAKAGNGSLADCLSGLLAARDAGGSRENGSDESVEIDDGCQAEVYAFYINRAKNVNANVPLAKACKAEAQKHCNVTWLFGGGDGKVIACLREAKGKLGRKCRAEVFRQQLAAARDYRADPDLRQYCEADAQKLCAGVTPGGGRVQACLRDHHLKISWECGEQLFRQEMEADDDMRLSVRLFQACLPDKQRFCAGVDAAHVEAKDCLVEHREDEGFSEGCRKELDTMLERRVRDFRLDSRLRRYCASDIVVLCSMIDSVGGDETDVNICLQDYVSDVRDERCKALVKQYQALAAQDVRFDVPLADACYDDRQKLCASVAPGSARVIRCLESQRDKLSGNCRATLFDEEMRFSENIDFQYPMKRACTKEIAVHCAKVPHGNARVIRCLQNNKGQKGFGRACLKEVLDYEQRASSDYRLNHRLRTMCAADVEALCKDVCAKGGDQVCGGTVLRCLTEARESLTNEACAKEVAYFLKMQVQDYHNDVILAAACRGDVEAFCKDVQPGMRGGVHECLRGHMDKISAPCRREQLILEQQQADSIELRPGLLKACSAERGLFCKDVPTGEGRVFRCLADNLADPDFGPPCRSEVIKKLQRRQANWKLDPSLRKACRADVSRLCRSEDEQASEVGLVYKCLVARADALEGGCRRELGRAMHMAFFVWIPGGLLTSPCDVDIAELCLKGRPNMVHETGNVAKCLADAVEAEGGGALTPQCAALAQVAAPPDPARAFDQSLAALLGGGLGRVEGATGAALVARDAAGRPKGITLTGWSAVAGLAALAVALLGGAVWGYRKWRGGPSGATVVLKGRQGYSRVATAGA